jgi:hypothetical protein
VSAPSFFVVIRVAKHSGEWMQSRFPYQHKTFEDAQKEAKRLADVSPGDRFYVLESRGSAIRQEPVTWDHHDTDKEIPF